MYSFLFVLFAASCLSMCLSLLPEDLARYWSTDTVVFVKYRAWRKKENERLLGMM